MLITIGSDKARTNKNIIHRSELTNSKKETYGKIRSRNSRKLVKIYQGIRIKKAITIISLNIHTNRADQFRNRTQFNIRK